MVPVVVESWMSMLSTHDPSLLDRLIADDAVFESPIVHTPQSGKARTIAYLTAADQVLNVPGFRYVAQWYGEGSAVLEFNVELDGILIDGVDMIWWDLSDRIVRFKVMVRPLKAINLLHQRMAQTLERMAAAAGKGR